jgi:succinate dehydrogenase hydrophobic anchor subunit
MCNRIAQMFSGIAELFLLFGFSFAFSKSSASNKDDWHNALVDDDVV